MCWSTQKHELMNRRIAVGDITVYKILKVRKNIFGKLRFHSLFHQKFTWKPGKTYHAELGKPESYFSCMEIYEGLHCFGDIKAAGFYADNSNEPVCIVPAIIPEGSYYYINENSEIVTENLRIL